MPQCRLGASLFVYCSIIPVLSFEAAGDLADVDHNGQRHCLSGSHIKYSLIPDGPLIW